jgi:hypothetical protein
MFFRGYKSEAVLISGPTFLGHHKRNSELNHPHPLTLSLNFRNLNATSLKK